MTRQHDNAAWQGSMARQHDKKAWQGRQADKAGMSIDVSALTANIFAFVLARQNKADWPGS
jgi:hypothetical protein